MAYTGHTFTFASGSGHDNSDYYGLRIATTPTLTTGTPEYEDYDIPGRQFGLSVPSGAWLKTTRTYNVSFPGESTGLIYPAWQNALDNNSTWTMTDNIKAIKYWLYRNNSWVKLTDTYDTSVFRLARINSEINFDQIPEEVAQTEITFEVDPRTYLNSGDAFLSVGSSIYNPGLPTNPVIRFNGSGGLNIVTTVNGVPKQYTISASVPSGKTMEIDCETMSIYLIDGSGSKTNGSAYVSRMVEFPMLGPGTNTILNNGLSAVKIKPRWWQP